METCNLGKCKVLWVTEKAIRVRQIEALGDTPTEYWIPKSHLAKGNECQSLGDVGECIASYAWWVRTADRKAIRDGKVRVLPYIPPRSSGPSVRFRRPRSLKGRMG